MNRAHRRRHQYKAKARIRLGHGPVTVDRIRCPDCDSDVTVVEVSPGIYRAEVAHDDCCPWWAVEEGSRVTADNEHWRPIGRADHGRFKPQPPCFHCDRPVLDRWKDGNGRYAHWICHQKNKNREQPA